MQNKNNRPLILEIEDVKEKIYSIINEAMNKKIPCYFLKDIIEIISYQLREGAKSELKAIQDNEQKNAKETGDERNNHSEFNA